jgi:hypothetical protein
MNLKKIAVANTTMPAVMNFTSSNAFAFPTSSITSSISSSHSNENVQNLLTANSLSSSFQNPPTAFTFAVHQAKNSFFFSPFHFNNSPLIFSFSRSHFSTRHLNKLKGRKYSQKSLL